MTYRGATAFVVIENAKSRSWAGCIAAITKPRAAAMETPANMANPALDQWAYTGSLSKLYECHSASVRSEGGPVTDIAGASLRAGVGTRLSPSVVAS